MAGIPFSPGEVGTKVRTTLRMARYRNSYDAWKDGGLPDYGTPTEYPNIFEKSSRSSYPRGVFITLPGGTVFRKATAYDRQSFSIPERPESPYYGLIRSVNLNTGGVGYSGAEDWGREVGYLVNVEPPIQGIDVPWDARNEAVTKALTKIADQKVNLGENLATLGQTVRLFTDKAGLLTSALKYAQKQKSWAKLLKKSAKDLSDAGPLNVVAKEYLAYVYGLKPLVGDVWTLAELMKTQSAPALLLNAEGRATRMQGLKKESSFGLSRCWIYRKSGRAESKVKCSIWARLDPEGTTLRSMNQLGLLNPFGLAWDLVPYSFVVDWFLPVGPVLYAMSAPAGLIFVDGSVSIRTSEVSEYEYQAFTGGYTPPSVATPGEERMLKVSRTYEGYARSTLSNWPIPGLWFDQDPFRGDRPFKALALAVLALSGTRPPIR